MWTYLFIAMIVLPWLRNLEAERWLYRTQVRRLTPGKAEVTLAPNWLGKLTFRHVRVGAAKRLRDDEGEYGWFWEANHRDVGEHVEAYIACAPLLALEDIPVEKLLAE